MLVVLFFWRVAFKATRQFSLPPAAPFGSGGSLDFQNWRGFAR